jgi:hypothetical protein
MTPTSSEGPPAAFDTPRQRPLADWARAAEGIQLAGVAVFLLLNTTGALPWGFWIDAVALWPILIMSAGVKIAFEKTRVPWLLLLSPVLVLGSMAWVASGARADVAAGPWTEDSVPRPEGVSRLTVDAHLSGTRLAARADSIDPSSLLETRWTSRDGRGGAPRTEVSVKDGLATATLRGGWRRGPVILPGQRQRWELRLPRELPVDLAVHGAMVRSKLDLSRGDPRKLTFRGAFLASGLELPAPAEATTIRLNGVFNLLEVSVPEGTPVRVGGAGLPFNLVTRRLEGAPGRPGYQIRVDGIFTIVTLKARPAPSRPEAEPGAGI